MSYPTDYQPTLKDPVPFFKPIVPKQDEGKILFGPANGVSYVGPLLIIPWRWNDNSGNPIFWGLTQFAEIETKANLLKQLPPGLRGARPYFVERYDVNYFDSEKLIDTERTTNLPFRGITYVSKNNETRMDIQLINSTGYEGTPWPVEGVTFMAEFMGSYCRELSKKGATIDAFITDYEFVPFAHYITTSLKNSISTNSNYTQSYYGLTSWNDFMIFYGGTASAMQTNTPSNETQYYLYNQSNWAWTKISQKYLGYNTQLAYYGPAAQIYPKLVSGNYEWYFGENAREDEAIIADGGFWPQGGKQGNAGSPVLYGRIRHISGDQSYGMCIKEGDSSRLWGWLYERRQFYRRGPRCLTSPSVSFLQAMMELRTAKRNDYNSPLVPHINSIYTYGYGSEGHFLYPEFKIGAGQSPAEFLNDRWYPINVVGSLYNVGGITSYDGTTNGFLVKTNIPIISETWYKQNISSITFDGATTAYQLNTSGLSGTTSALAYYFNQGLTSGDTYVFSYFVDASRGFTGFNARIINWTTSDAIGSAPSLTTTSGITFTQILPVTGSPAYLQTPIQYNVGDSGWVKVAFQFNAPSSSPLLGLHVYHARNNDTTGYTAFIKDVFLNHQANGRTHAFTFIGNQNRIQSLEYYYKGLTPGLTYTFSYYLDVSRSYTGSNALQTINHFQEPTYYLPLGITYNQTLPAVRNSLFHTAGMSYGSATGWTKISYSFNIPVGDTYDPIFRDTMAASVFKSLISAMDLNQDILNGCCFYLASPEMQVQQGVTTTNIPVAPINYESISRWNYGPPIGWCDAQKGPNRRYNLYLVNRGGNSAYYSELIYHSCLCGSAKFGFFNYSDYVNFGITGSIRGGGSEIDGPKFALYIASGLTQHVTSALVLDGVLRDVHEKIGGFTIASADVSRPDWLAPYIASGAPNTTGTTWWWRVTALPGYTVYCNGITLNSNSNVGTWLGTTGPTLAGSNITYTKWTEVKPEPSIVSPFKQINFAGMTSITQLTAEGFTFSRGSTATYVDSTGKIVVVGPNVPRFDHDPNTLESTGLLIETAHTNLLNWSESFATSGGSQNNWSDTKISRTTGITSPSGLLSAIKFTATGSDASLISTTSVGTNALRSFSIFMRGMTGTENVSYTYDGGTTWIPIIGTTQYYYDSNSGITYTIRPFKPNVSTSWKRFAFEASNTNHRVGIKLGNTGDSVEIWGAQLQTRPTSTTTQYSIATSYIPTTSSTATQAADSCSLSGVSFNSWYGQTYGSFAIEFRNALGGTPLYLEKDSNNYFGFNVGNFDSNTFVYSKKNGQLVSKFISLASVTQETLSDTNYKYIFTYGQRGLKLSTYNEYNGCEYNYDNLRSLNWAGNTIGAPEITKLTFTSGDNLTIKRLRYWPFVFDEYIMRDMSMGGVDASLGQFGAYG